MLELVVPILHCVQTVTQIPDISQHYKQNQSSQKDSSPVRLPSYPVMATLPIMVRMAVEKY